MDAIRSFQAGSGLSHARRIATVLLAAVAAGCGGGYSGSSGGGGMAAHAGPTITTQPMSQSVTAGSAVTFTVAASGANGGYGGSSLTYQWLMNGSAIVGATMASYMIATTSAGMSGEMFSVQVTDAGGTTTSNSATLMVM